MFKIFITDIFSLLDFIVISINFEVFGLGFVFWLMCTIWLFFVSPKLGGKET